MQTQLAQMHAQMIAQIQALLMPRNAPAIADAASETVQSKSPRAWRTRTAFATSARVASCPAIALLNTSPRLAQLRGGAQTGTSLRVQRSVLARRLPFVILIVSQQRGESRQMVECLDCAS